MMKYLHRIAALLLLGLVLPPILLTAQATSAVPAFVPGPFHYTRPDPVALPDGSWYRSMQVQTADLWNGGPDGLSGQGAYRQGFTGFVHAGLDRQWNQVNYWNANTVIAQSRAVFANVEAYAASGKPRFLTAAQQEADFLIAHFKDGKNGGYYWQVGPDGSTIDAQKQGYGQMHALLVLSRLAAFSRDPRYLAEAGLQLDLIQAKLLDPDWPGAVLYGKDRLFKRVNGVKNIDTFTHYFEALQAYWDVAPPERKAAVGKLIVAAGNLLTKRLAVPMASRTGQRFVAYNYADDWTPSQLPYSRDRQWSGARHASPGHTIELAFLASRAVERGFDPSWLPVAREMLDYCLDWAIDPVTGGMRHDTLDYDGSALEGNPDNAFYIYWAQGETVRALLHFSVLRDPGLAAAFRRAQGFMVDHLIDREYGDWYPEIVAATLQANRGDKGDVWKGDYHEAMMMAEAIRLAGLKTKP